MSDFITRPQIEVLSAADGERRRYWSDDDKLRMALPTQGLIRSIARLLGVAIAVPDFSTLPRRGNSLTLRPKPRSKSDKPLQLVVDSTGLKIFGEGDWFERKHKTKCKRRTWRKLPLGLDLVSGEIVCSDLTKDDVGDPTALPGLLDQVDGPIDRFLADGAYDGEPTSDLLAARFGSTIKVTILPPRNAIPSPRVAYNPTTRDRDIAQFKARGRMAWQKSSGYNQRSRGETQMGPWKTVIGPKLKARTFENPKTEARIGVRVLNQMTALGRPSFERTA
ncbi:IS5 family transposase [Sulfitobacter sp. 1A13496]|uniref:IS5 family transposase n=1 Tax=Sulfitobacter TaxID=60136 RepID=UPI003746130E